MGDKIVFEKNENKKYNVKNGEIARIINIKDNMITVVKGDETLTIDTNEYNYFNQGYATSLHKSQGGTGERVWAVMPSNIQDFSSFYVAVTRAVSDFNIITDDKDMLKHKINFENSKENVADFLGAEKIKELLDENKLSEALELNNSQEISEEEQEQIEKVFDSYQNSKNWETVKNELNTDEKVKEELETDPFLGKLEEVELNKEDQITFDDIDRMLEKASLELQKNRRGGFSY